MKAFLKKIFNLFPAFIKEPLYRMRMKRAKKRVIETWISKGRPYPPPHAIKQRAVENFREKSGYQILVETGTYKGDMMEAQKRNFRSLFSIELSEEFYNECCQKFKKDKHVHLLLGDSGTMMAEVMKKINEPAIFWLDGHYSGGNTALGNTQCPIFGEIDAIFNEKGTDHILLIDDARDFNGTCDY
ncbi:MAG: hypothetical protein IAF38_17100, partial [Bacteroidia bacterium]|nr:hypothetical protein [Bacteroidia bacterium]